MSTIQVDIRALKGVLWDNLVGVLTPPEASQSDEANLESKSASFQDAMSAVAEQGAAAGDAQELSVQLCFVCLLHLANEHGLRVTAGDDLASLTVSGR